MKLLVIDTSGPVCGVAVMDGDKVLCEYTAQNRLTHSASLMPMTEAALLSAGTELKALDAVAAVTGPGSFTGVRIGVATAKGLAHGAGLPCIAVDALEALALSAGSFAGTVCPLQDARAGQVYGAAFRNGDRLTANEAVPLGQFLDEIEGLDERFLFLGDGMRAHRDALQERLGERAAFPLPCHEYLRPAAAGWAAMKSGKTVSYTELQATYLRPPNAQKNKKLLEAMSRG